MSGTIRKLKVSDRVANLIQNLHPHLKKKVKASLHAIVSDPYSGKALKDELAGSKISPQKTAQVSVAQYDMDKKPIFIVSGCCRGNMMTGLRSFRVSRFRIIYRIPDQQMIEIVAIGPRERIYEDTFQLLNRRENR